MAADSKEIASYPLIFASDQAFDFTKVDKGNLVIRQSHVPGRLAVDYRNADGNTSSFHLVYLSGRGEWTRFLGSLKRKRDEQPLSPSPVSTREQQTEEVNALFKFLRPDPTEVILPTAKQATKLPQFEHYYYELPHAVQICDVKGIKALLDAKANPNSTNFMVTPLQKAAIHPPPPEPWHINRVAEILEAKFEATGLLLKAKADPNFLGKEDPRPPLIIALQAGNSRISELLLTARAILDTSKYHVEIRDAMSSSSQITALLTKVEDGRLVSHALDWSIARVSPSAVEKLLEGKANVNTTYPGGYPRLPLVSAVNEAMGYGGGRYRDKEIQIARLLLSARADPNGCSDSEYIPIEMALAPWATYQCAFAHAKLLLEAKATLSAEKCVYFCEKFIKENEGNGLTVLIEAKAATPSLLSRALKNALMDSVFLPDHAMISKLVNNNANVNITGFNGETLLHRLTRQSPYTIAEGRGINHGTYESRMVQVNKFRATIPQLITKLLDAKALIIRNADRLMPFELLERTGPQDAQNKEIATLLHQAFKNQLIRARQAGLSFLSMFHRRTGARSLGPKVQTQSLFHQQCLRATLQCAETPTKTRAVTLIDQEEEVYAAPASRPQGK